MHSLFFTLSVLPVLAAVHAAPQGQPSNVPTCTFSCPHEDNSGRIFLGIPPNNGYLYCINPGVICRYSDTTGALTQDNDDGICPTSATTLSCSARRRSAVPRAPSPPMAAPVARAPTPENFKIRASLKRRRPVPDA